jgi:hypothetical protein
MYLVIKTIFFHLIYVVRFVVIAAQPSIAPLLRRVFARQQNARIAFHRSFRLTCVDHSRAIKLNLQDYAFPRVQVYVDILFSIILFYFLFFDCFHFFLFSVIDYQGTSSKPEWSVWRSDSELYSECGWRFECSFVRDCHCTTVCLS